MARLQKLGTQMKRVSLIALTLFSTWLASANYKQSSGVLVELGVYGVQRQQDTLPERIVTYL
ncbi:exported hypothetical protein [Vibrio coralliirubri]|nr:exported hypothetical protein [Vibrio coralliirubri]